MNDLIISRFNPAMVKASMIVILTTPMTLMNFRPMFTKLPLSPPLTPSTT